MAAIRGWLNQRGPVAGAGGGFQPANRQVTKTLEFSGTQWGSLLYQYIFKERTGGKDRRRYKSSSTFNPGIFSRNVSSAVGYTLYSVKSNAWRTLAMGGIFFAAKKYAEASGAGSGLDAVVAAAAVAAEVAGDFLINRAAAQREKQLETAEFQALAERNQHLRRGMAAALRRGLNQARPKILGLPTDPYDALFRSWDLLLKQAEEGGDALEELFPAEQFAESQWEATNPYSPNLDEDARDLATLLREWLAGATYTRWSKEEALDFARKALPYYQQAFADDLAGDSNGLLFRAFTVKGINQIRAENRAGHEITHRKLDELRELIQPRPLDPGKVRTWSLPIPTDYFVGRNQFLDDLHGKLQTKRKALIHAAGGFGKTQAALAYVLRFGGYYDDVVWVRAADGQSLFESYRAIAAGLGLLLQEEPTEAEVQRAVKIWLAGQPGVLVVFDNLDDPSLAKDYWPVGDHKPFLLATSQKRGVSELERMEPLGLDVWEPAEALDFLMRRTGRSGLDDAERRAAKKLAEETGYLPLALEQAGVYIAKDGVSFAAYLRTYQREHLKLLEKYGPQAGVYRLSVATTWQASMKRVPAAARELLSAVSHLAPNANPYELVTCAPDALGPVLAAALTDQTEADPLAALLGSLQEYSLVQTDGDARTFSLHKLLQEVVGQDQTEAERSEWMACWVRVFDRFLPKDVGHQESAPYSRGLPAFATLFARVDEKHPAIADAARLAGWYVYHFNYRGRWREAEPLAVRAMQVRERVLGPEHPDTLASVNDLATLYERQGRYAEAEPLYLRALAARERVLGLEYPDTLISVNNLAALYDSQGRYAEAEPLYQRALAARERVLGPEHPNTLTSVNNLAGLYESQGRHADAEPLYQRALATFERVLGPEHPSTLTSVNNLAYLYESQGRYAEAEPLCQRALAASERVLGPEHPNTLISVNNLAGLYGSQGRYAEAEPLYQRALAASERVLGPEHPFTLSSANNLAALYRSQGRYAEAEPLFQRALAGLERVLGKDHPNTKVVRGNLKRFRSPGK